MDGPLAGVVELKEMYKEIYLGKIDLLYIQVDLKPRISLNAPSKLKDTW